MEIPGYSIQRLIGKGGMATVYLAIQESLHRPVVLKILDQMNTQHAEDMVERFLAEGRIIASLQHPNIITIYDIGLADRSLFISMEYVQGGDLKRRMELPISAGEALEYLVKIAGALGEAHKHGIVHRDVKPANILFRDDATPLLTDFGIAKQVDTETDLTSTGIFLGSPNYVSPEQADGVRIDGRADIYSLGCIFYEMLTGKKPYISDSVIDIVIQHKSAPVPTLPKEYQDMQPLLNRMMAKKRDERFTDAETLTVEIAKIQKAHRRKVMGADLDVTGAGAVRAELRERRAKQILGGVMLLGLILFSSLKYVEITLKAPSVRTDRVSTDTVLQPGPAPLPVAQAAVAESGAPEPEAAPANPGTPEPEAAVPAPPPSEEVIQALVWLGKQSLEEFKLTFPPKDNAYYYFNRLLELDPGNPTAVRGILEIADQYAVLAEQALARNEMEKSAAYIDIGLRINPDNQALLSLQNLMQNQDRGFLAAIKSLFAGK
ncbi:MAG: serine/threonine protein kinase [Gammaproteobacteria bacterium]|nr:serine/threonine protein kinase [Gammaproteobacteria bacterium]